MPLQLRKTLEKSGIVLYYSFAGFLSGLQYTVFMNMKEGKESMVI
jgi:hypothetical protein